MAVRTRVAPSPTGHPHIGTIYQSALDKAYAISHSGQFLVRIEDTDRSRFIEGVEDELYEALDWFKLTEDESPRKMGSFGPYKQSERLAIYKKYVLELVAKGYAYYCFCTKERLDEVRKNNEANKKPPMYDKHCRNLSSDEVQKKLDSNTPYVIRMKIPENQTIEVNDLLRGKILFDSNTIDDQVLIKSDGFPTYHLAVVVDDHLMQISHAMRGPEWIPSFPKHKLLYEYFGWEMPVFIHTPLITNMDGSKMSKRQGHTAVSWYKEQGYLPEAVINFMCLNGWSHPEGKEIFSYGEFCKFFDFKDLHGTLPKFDMQKLDWINGEYIRSFNLEELYSRLIEFDSSLKEYEKNKFMIVLGLVYERLKKLSEIKELITYFYTAPANLEEIKQLATKESKKSYEETREVILKVVEVLNGVNDFTKENIETALHKLAESLQTKPREFFMPIRIIVSGTVATPPLADVLEVLGREETLKRLKTF